MGLAELTLENFRCIERAELVLPPGITLVRGPNGSGKTSFLEAIYLLGRGRSFRTSRSESLIRHGAEVLNVAGRVGGTTPLPVRVQLARQEPTMAKIAGVLVRSRAELAQAFPVQALEPGIHKLIEEASPRRRRWLDWAVFHVEPPFVEAWQRYGRALRQRNAALRTAPDTAQAWDVELVRHGEVITAARARLIETLAPYWRDTVQALADLPAELNYLRGWSSERSLAVALEESFAQDRRRGVTLVGPHRADVEVRLAGRNVRLLLSRGQQKLVAASLVLSQLQMLRERLGLSPTLLLDDPAAELDAQHLGQLLGRVRALECQLIVTSLDSAPGPLGRPQSVFHVEQGRVQPV
jgi:DNA replication and repair protein RecF